ncbi:Meiotic recombination protein DMC1/LIM15 [Dirofilaria immitis]|nr:Meiotic recombination protein DMC1/LIM15 [Dirofilaria immitis]
MEQIVPRLETELYENEMGFYQDVELLQSQGINAADIKKLLGVGICTIKGIMMTTRKRLCDIKGLSEAKNNGFITALEVTERRKLCYRISTGSRELDNLLGGGIESQAITEVFGNFALAKHSFHILYVIPNETSNFKGGKVIYIDTENTFRPDRLRQINERFKMDQEAMLDNILYARAYTSEHQMELLDFVAAKFHEELGVFKLLIVDSVMALFRVDYSGRGELAERQQKLAQMLSRLQKIAEEYNVAIFITNQMTADPGAGMTFQTDPKKPVGGHILAHASTTRIMLKKGRGEIRIAKIYDSPDLPENEATFAIATSGVTDVKD